MRVAYLFNLTLLLLWCWIPCSVTDLLLFLRLPSLLLILPLVHANDSKFFHASIVPSRKASGILHVESFCLSHLYKNVSLESLHWMFFSSVPTCYVCDPWSVTLVISDSSFSFLSCHLHQPEHSFVFYSGFLILFSIIFFLAASQSQIVYIL